MVCRQNIEVEMLFKKIKKIVENKLMNRLFKLFGYDYVSGVKVQGRNDLKQLGSEYGGWVVPLDLLGPDSICYCAGCGEDITFDLGLIELFCCDVYGFDPTPRAIAYVNKAIDANSKYHFYELGLWDEKAELKFFEPKEKSHVSHSLVNLQKTGEYIVVKVKRLSDVMSDLGHQKIDLMKLDIEGAEYKVIDSILEDGIYIKILCVEYDECFNAIDSEYKARVRGSVNKLISSGYDLVCAQSWGNYTFVKNDTDVCI